MTTHELKTDSIPFAEVWDGAKTFELRRDDRNFRRGDMLRLRQTEHASSEMAQGAPLIYSGREVLVYVLHILHGPLWGLEAGWVIMSILVAERKYGPKVEAGE